MRFYKRSFTLRGPRPRERNKILFRLLSQSCRVLREIRKRAPMALMSFPIRAHLSSLQHTHQRFVPHSSCYSTFSNTRPLVSSFINPHNLRLISFQSHELGNLKASQSENILSNGEDGSSYETFEDWKVKTSNPGISFLAKLAIALGLAVTATVISYCFKRPTLGSALGVPFVVDGSPNPVVAAASSGFNLTICGYRIVLPQHTPGWVYFCLLMAAGCGLFISEEALNIWVGTSLARTLTLDGTWKSFIESFSDSGPYIISTVLWVYWGVCISDLIPFYLGKFFRQTKASEDVCSKLGIDKEKAMRITRAVQKYGNLIGFVERFSLGVRNPTSFLAGMLDVSSDCFFAGVCCGGLVTLLIQLAIGFLLREQPLVAVASVATAVGIWTVFPYALAASTALFLYLRQRYST